MITIAINPVYRSYPLLHIRIAFATIALFLLFQLAGSTLFAQQVKTIGDPGLNKFTLYNTYGPMRSVPSAFAGGAIANRHAYIFPATALSGIAAQSNIDSIAFYKIYTGVLQGTVNLKIFLKNTNATDFGAGSLTWETERATCVSVYDASPNAIISGAEGYKKFKFNNSFLYTGGNLEMLVEYSQTSPATDYLSWAWDNISVSYLNNTVKYDHVLSTSPPATLTSSANIHPVMQVYFTLPQVTPLKLVDFSVIASANGYLVKWNTAEEKNVLDFTVEKSTDGIMFHALGKLPAKNVASENKYEFTDVEKPANRQYYRLQIRDKDGKIQYSKTIFTWGDNRGAAFKVRPNPAKNFLEIQLPKGSNEYASLLVVDAAGKIYAEKIVRIGMDNAYTAMDINQLPGGIYRLLLLERDGHKSYQPFVKL